MGIFVLLAAIATRAGAQSFDDDSSDLHVLSMDDGDDRLLSGFPLDRARPPRSGSAWTTGRRTGSREPAGPPLSSVVDVALRTAGLADDPVPSWRRRSRWSALIPAISARVGNSQRWRDVVDPTVSRALSYDVRASWRLDRLVFDPNEARFTAFDITRRRERRRIIAAVSHLYYVWADASAVAAGALTGDGDAAQDADSPVQAAALMQARRAEAELDALTDGWFSETRAKSLRSR